MIKSFIYTLIFFLVTQFISAQVTREVTVDKYQAYANKELPYQLMKPYAYNPNETYPLILSLHGAGGKGSDNSKQLRTWNDYLATDEIRKEYPCYVLAPQTNVLWSELQLLEIKKIIKDLKSVDMNRIYVLGHSMGGYGTYKFIQLEPNYFAAAAPSAGSGLATTEDFIDVSKIKHIPIWVFHGDKDPKCPYEKDRKVFEDMKKIGGNMKFTTWVGDKHGGNVALKMVAGGKNGVTEFSSDVCDKETVFLTWLFKQKMKK